MKTKISKISARERILLKAEELFYKQGYQATGINQIIAEANVAKQTFYDNFPSKDELCLTYVMKTGQEEQIAFKNLIEEQKTPLAKYMCTAELMVPWVEETNFRGCAFLNMVPEVPNHKDPIRNASAQFYRDYEELMIDACKQLIASDKKKYGHLSAKQLAKDYITLVAGGLALSALHHSIKPMKDAVRLIKELLKK